MNGAKTAAIEVGQIGQFAHVVRTPPMITRDPAGDTEDTVAYRATMSAAVHTGPVDTCPVCAPRREVLHPYP